MQRSKQNGRYIRNNNTWSTLEFSKKESIQKDESKTKLIGDKSPVYKPYISTGSNYANVLKRSDNESSGFIKSNDIGYITHDRKVIPRGRIGKTVRNQVPKSNINVSNDVWEYRYFKHILDLNDIFSEGANKLGIETNTVNFLDIFSKFIRDCSSGEISRFIEDLDEQTEDSYLEFTIKRNEM